MPDEEIVVVDGNSNDGTVSYLDELFHQKKIQQYISEQDQNQAEAWNKGFFMAEGKIIKKIMDDDVFSLTAIRKCKDWMLENPAVDICISNTLQTTLAEPEQISKTGRLSQYLNWQQGKTHCFTFSDVYMLIRKSSLSFTGLYDTQFWMIDWEFSLRASFLGAKIAYYTGYNSLTVQTPGNVTSLSTEKILKKEALIAKVKYGYAGDQSEFTLWSKIKIFIGTKLNRFKRNASFIAQKSERLPDEFELKSIYNNLYEVLELENKKGDFNFVC